MTPLFTPCCGLDVPLVLPPEECEPFECERFECVLFELVPFECVRPPDEDEAEAFCAVGLPLAATEPEMTVPEDECVFPFTPPVVGCNVVEAAAGSAVVVRP
jgi:hypothetical protein